MRIESPVGCPNSAGDPAEEKAVPGVPAGLFTAILDCFRDLVSGPPSGNTPASETPAATGMSVNRCQTGPTETSSFPAMRQAVATHRDGVRADDSRLRPGSQENSEACAGPAMTASAGAPFNLAIPGFVGSGQPTSVSSEAAVRQTGGTGPEAFATTKAGAPAGLQQAEIPGPDLNTQAGACFDLNPSGEIDGEPGEETTLRVDGSSVRRPTSANVEPDEGVAGPQASATAESRTLQPAAVQASATALMIDAGFLRSDTPSTSDGKSAVPSSVSAQSASGILSNGEAEPTATSPAASATAWMPRRSGGATKANMSQAGGRTAKSAAAPQPTAPLEERFGYTIGRAVADGTGATVVANLDERQEGASLPAQKLADKAVSSAPNQQADRQAAGSETDSRPGATDPRAEARPQSQSESATRPAGPPKAAAVDPATLAVEMEKVSAGRGRLRTTFEGGAQEAPVGSSLSAMARDAQISQQSAPGVKDVKAPAFVFEVAERISAVVAGGRGEVTIQLKPDEFGRMNIVAESGASGILARITTESSSLKQYLESNLPALHQALQDQGLKVERIDVLVQEGLSQQQSANQWHHNFGHAPGGHDSERSPRFATIGAARAGEPANEITLDEIVLGSLYPNRTFHTIA
jgi:flagellar hook-length control protein FliK